MLSIFNVKTVMTLKPGLHETFKRLQFFKKEKRQKHVMH